MSNKFIHVHCSNPSFEKIVEGKLLKEAINHYITQLTSDYRNILEMKIIQNLTYKQMAEELDTTEGAVRQKLARAREKIRKKIKRYWGDFDG